MGTVWVDMPLGNDQGLNQITWDYQIDEIVEPVGLSENRYWRSTTLNISTENEVCAIGIDYPNAGGMGAADITEVSLTLQEITTPPNYLPRNPGDDLETGVRQMYVGTDCLIYLATQKSYTIAGQGQPPFDPETAQNDFLSNYATADFDPAYDGVSFSIAIDSTAQIGNIQQTTPKDGLWTWNLAAEAKVENPSPSNTNILSPPSDVSDLVPSGMLVIYQNVQSMSKGTDSKATSNWTLACHYTS